ncbi:IMPACT family protein [Paracandidimonas soli]|uniref:Putative YigZ family protein n=1 Tax=Paracandidimonas soli TaxID=1917182 RepID=A0A4R3VD98_9BURK|nr:YigZ family protein [Paracandidimonas soli]TCV01569.1 putative YigZ family protein [Paracandidimonas soli]
MPYTLTAPASYEEDIRKSRFLVFAQSVASVQEAMDFFAANSVPAATHNCWAYRIGDLYRFNDDGEPGGTAGRPILQAIESQQCDRVAVLVVRWFGGIKLGPGGLVRAYGGTAAQCLRLADKTELVQETEVRCSCLFGDMALVRSRFAGFGIRVVDEQFDAGGVQWRLAVPSMEVDAFVKVLTDLTRGQAQAEIGE